MIGVLVVTHGDFANGIVRGMELICGPQEKLETVSLYMEDDVEAFAKKVKDTADALNDGDGVLILMDLMGGSPANVVCRFIQEEDQMEGLTGLNFPMLFEAVGSRLFMNLQELVEACSTAGASGIINLKQALNACADEDDDE